MKKLIALLGAMIISMPAYAADNACMTQAADQKLSGVAQSSFIRKCVRDGCEATSQEKKLAGAAKSSFTTLDIPILISDFVGQVILMQTNKSERLWPEQIIPRLRLLGESFSQCPGAQADQVGD